MSLNYIDDLTKQVEIPTDGILTRTLYEDEQVTAILFGFSAGEERAEQMFSLPAILHFIQGEAHLTLGEDEVEACPGTWVHMPARMPHSIQTVTSVVMLLLLIKTGSSGK